MNRKLLIALVGVAAALPLAGCVSDGYYGGPVGPGPIAYDGYYDDYYGPIYDGYWGDGGGFYYRNSEHGHWRHDSGGHFRRDMGPGGMGQGGMGPGGGRPGGRPFHAMHGSFNPPAGGHGGRHH